MRQWCVLVAAFSMSFFTAGKSLAADATVLTPAQMREDLAVLREKMNSLDRSFDDQKRQYFEQLLDETAQSADRLNAAEFELSISRAVAVARNGHTTVFMGRNQQTLPVRLWWFKDGLYVIKTEPSFSGLLGARVDKLGPLGTEQALARAAPYISGTDNSIKAKSPAFLVTLALLHEIGATPNSKQVAVTFTLRNGTHRTIRMGAQSAPDPEPRRSFYAALIPSDAMLAGRWPHVLDTVTMRPLIFQPDVDLDYRWLQTDALYLRSNRIFGTRENRYGLMEKLINLLHADVATKRPANIIVDLRLNTGGDFFNTIDFAHALPAMMPPGGRIYVLVGPVTFSAALVTAALLRENGKENVLLVGEPMGDGETFWSEGVPFELPNSHIQINPAKWKWSLRQPCADPSRCYFAGAILGPHGVGLEPDISVSATFADYAAGRDPVLDSVMQQVRAR